MAGSHEALVLAVAVLLAACDGLRAYGASDMLVRVARYPYL
jgi:hypothetical protein